MTEIERLRRLLAAREDKPGFAANTDEIRRRIQELGGRQ